MEEKFSDREYEYLSAMLQMLQAFLEINGTRNLTLERLITAFDNGCDILMYETDDDEIDEDTPDLFRKLNE